MLLFLTALALTAAGFFVVQALTASTRQRHRSVSLLTEYDSAQEGAPRAARANSAPRSNRPLTGLARLSLRLTPRQDLDTVRLRLARAGLAPRWSAQGFLMGKLVFAVAGVVLGVLFGSGSPGRAVVFACLFGYGFFTLPDFYVSRRLTERAEAIEAELPGALDVLAVSVEAGLGIDAAIAMLVEHSPRGPLVDEFGLALAEIRIGRSRDDAMHAFADRVDLPDVRSFVNAMVQQSRLGIPMSRIIRSLGDEVRQRRQVTAEERANKMPVKLTFPLAFFILPTLFIVALGPAMIVIMHSLK